MTKVAKIKMLILDVDGTLTDGGMYITEKGDEFKKFNAKDGIAIKDLTAKGFPVGIISHSITSKAVKRRVEMLNIQYCYVGGNKDKVEVLNNWLKERNLKPKEVAFVGDDINDMVLFDYVGLTACPADAHPYIKAKANIVLPQNGGDACVRHFIDNYLGMFN